VFKFGRFAAGFCKVQIIPMARHPTATEIVRSEASPGHSSNSGEYRYVGKYPRFWSPSRCWRSEDAGAFAGTDRQLISKTQLNRLFAGRLSLLAVRQFPPVQKTTDVHFRPPEPRLRVLRQGL